MLSGLDSAVATPPLSRFVERAQAFVSKAGTIPPVQLPNGRTSLVFRAFEGGSRGDVCVVGPRTRAVFKNSNGLARAVILQFKPGSSASLLGVAPTYVVDRIVSLEELWGGPGRHLLDDLLAIQNPSETVDRLADALARRLRLVVDTASARLARRAVTLLEATEVRVDSVAQRLGVTPRHLRRAFTEAVGVGPKDFARSVRLQRAVRMASASTDWGRIAAEAGYYDQAHLIGDFRDLIGLTPGAFARSMGNSSCD